MALGTAGAVVAAALVAGAVGAGTVFLLGEPARAPSQATPAGDAVAALQERLDLQEKEISSLRARIEETAQGVRAGRPGIAVEHPGISELTPGTGLQRFDPAAPTRIRENGTASPSAADLASMPPEERAKYEAVYKALREKEQEEGRKARLAAYEAGLRARLDRIPETVGLTADLKDAAVKILLARGENLRVVFEESRTAGGADAYRAAQEKADAIRRESRDALAQALTVEQAKAVEDAADRGGPGIRNRADVGGRRTPRNGGTGGGDAGSGNAGGGNPGGGNAGGRNGTGGAGNPPR